MLLMMVANMESERIGERVASVKEHLHKQGRYLGGAVAAGYSIDADGNLRVARNWDKHLATMRQLSDEGLSSRAIAGEMRKHGLEISHNTVYRCLTQRRKTDAVVSVA